MADTTQFIAGAAFPSMTWAQTDGGRLDPAGMRGWRLLVVYRGAHCPLCESYLGTLEGLLGEFRAAGIAVAAVSGDPKEKAEAKAAEQGWSFPVGYGMTVEEMRQLGLYVSTPRSPEETDRPFPEPAIFAIRPDGTVQIVDVSNAPFARPDLAALLKGLRFIQAKDYPVRGTA
ncbi:redoxin domain-containing protein [Teichococcus aestuarii]|uniref:redoxin domain-containing protein n=1 Tax=Teichococcus aestuarii TaxID=568898 RepID=UPI003622F0F8